MNEIELDKILNICYTKKVEVLTKRGKRIITERNVTPEEIAQMIATEFGFILTYSEEETNG